MMWNQIKEKLMFWKSDDEDVAVELTEVKSHFLRWVVAGLAFILLGFFALGIYWSGEPEIFSIDKTTALSSRGGSERIIIGVTTVATTEQVAQTLLNKPGGFLSNDVIPPSVMLDNIPSFEFGALVQVRDMTSALRNHMSRSQSQSLENKALMEADAFFNNSHTKWIVPAAETQYQKAIDRLASYRMALASENDPDTQFYARADNLRAWLELVEKRLGSLSQRLSASVGQERINTDLAGDSSATQSTHSARQLAVKTPWLEIDNNFYEARGACWALIELLRAVQVDFDQVLEKKNAKASLAQIIRELEATQETVWSPMILNGSGFGFVANHSLVMANYISRANAGVIDLRELLSQG